MYHGDPSSMDEYLGLPLRLQLKDGSQVFGTVHAINPRTDQLSLHDGTAVSSARPCSPCL